MGMFDHLPRGTTWMQSGERWLRVRCICGAVLGIANGGSAEHCALTYSRKAFSNTIISTRTARKPQCPRNQ